MAMSVSCGQSKLVNSAVFPGTRMVFKAESFVEIFLVESQQSMHEAQEDM